MILLKTLLSCWILLPCFAQTTLPKIPPHSITWDHVEKDTIFFSSSTQSRFVLPLKTELFDLQYLGTLQPQDAKDPSQYPYFIFNARPCEKCFENQDIYIVRPEQVKPTGFVYPGRILDLKTKELLLESQMFFGRCLKNHQDVFLVFQKEKVDRKKKLQSSVLIAEAGPHFLTEIFLDQTRTAPKLSQVLKFVKQKRCTEIPGRNRFTHDEN